MFKASTSLELLTPGPTGRWWRGVLVACFWATAATAHAQEPAVGGPYRGLFGPTATSAATPLRSSPIDSLDLSIQTFWLSEQARTGAGSSDSAPSPTTSHAYAGLVAAFSKAHEGRRLTYHLRGSSQFREQPGAGLSFDTQWLAVSVEARASERTSVTFGQRVGYAPLFSPTPTGADPSLAGLVSVAAPVQGVSSLKNVTTESAAGVSTQLSRLTSAGISYAFSRVGFSSTGVAVSTQALLVTVNHTIGRDLAYRVTYSSLSTTNSGAAAPGPARSHDVGITLNYSPAMSHRTTFVFGVTPDLASRQSSSSASSVSTAPSRRLSITIGGVARIERQFTRTWRADAGYQRMLYYLPGYSQPILADAATSSAHGTFFDRFTASVSAAYSRGVPDVQQSQDRVTSLSAAARLEFRPTREAIIHAEYRHDAYSMSGGITQLPGLSSNSSRGSFNVGFTINIGPSGRRERIR
ncbi:MAG: hypothetical protein WCP29_01155 [Acidobacteriota bacterium]